ncbi:P-loop NTPase fold protein [Edaphobacter modestus]|uniref:KAP-like P-loop domain-containing protein n=1 Tax=Edaphobacter modestus TaxID=388466 RepID=A0A4Q7YRC2_9BACT|nr:P-loop NTPase fold protein [Edaphobacter modestus]RZU40038.1 KAP-like P-loop domain-containing protein [Edaphobacter modestus]
MFTGLGGAGYILLVAWLLKKATEIVGNPLEIDWQKYSSDPRYDDRRAFIQTFHEDFIKIVETYSEGRKIFIFIDDLDRCEIPRAAELMQSINLLLSDSSQIVHILGIDREKIAAGLAAKYHVLLPYLDERKEISLGRLGLEFGFSFLEKFIQIPFQVPRPTKREVKLFLDALNENRRKPDEYPGASPSAGTMFYAKADSPMVKRIVADVAPALEYNPRRIKQFINQFRLSAIIASQTGLFDPGIGFAGFTPEILAKLLVITLRWPSLITDALSSRKLLFALEVMAISDDPEQSLKIGDFEVTGGLAELWFKNDALKALLRVGIEIRTPHSRDIVIPRQSLEKVDLVRYLQVSPAIRSKLSREDEEKPTDSPPTTTKTKIVGIGEEFKRDPDYHRGLAGLIKQ